MCVCVCVMRGDVIHAYIVSQLEFQLRERERERERESYIYILK